MKTTRLISRFIAFIWLSFFLLINSGTARAAVAPPSQNKPIIQLALILDTSTSMQGLLDQAKTRIWQLVNTLAKASRQGKSAEIKIALYEYGNARLGSDANYMQQVLPFTNNLDVISKALFSLSPKGSTEYCGAVIQKAITELDWQSNPHGLNLIFIAGNEAFTQGTIDYKMACGTAARQNIIVNTIFCGMLQEGIHHQWHTGASLTGGQYANLDMTIQQTVSDSPYDEAIAAKNSALNETYIPYGKEGLAQQENQIAQDENAMTYGYANAIARTNSKISHLYNNNSWDLVDAYQNNQIKLKSLKPHELPPIMRTMTLTEKENYIQWHAERREKINAEIQSLLAKRQGYLKSETQKEVAEIRLENIMTKAIKKQARGVGFEFSGDPIMLNHLSSYYPINRTAYVNYDFFEETAQFAKVHRASRLIPFETFIAMSADSNTIILDTRSKAMYDRMHIKGAVHLNFSDFTQDNLAKVIPSTQTRILIYCNNNFSQEPKFQVTFATKYVKPKQIEIDAAQLAAVSSGGNLSSLYLNQPVRQQSSPQTLALNIPTYINLFGYGYRNVYELSELVYSHDGRLELEGTDIN